MNKLTHGQIALKQIFFNAFEPLWFLFTFYFKVPRSISLTRVSKMSDLVNLQKLEGFSNYAEKHDLFDMFGKCVSKLIVARPADPYQFIMDHFSKPRGKAIILLAPPSSGLSSTVSLVD